ncbi:MAG: RNA methyltransferase [Armatimonadetes bacterium]|nr:RNA methyltransferase [Armatimonadota bacterium]
MIEIELISSIKHPAIVQARTDLAKIVGRLHKTYPVEDFDMLEQALDAGIQLKQAFFRENTQNPNLNDFVNRLSKQNIPCYRVTPGVFTRIMPLGYNTSIEALAVAEVQKLHIDNLVSHCDKHAIVLVGEKIQDPRNVGVLIRNADAWGVKFVIFGNSADAYSRASVRSTTGSIFRVPIVQSEELTQDIAKLKNLGFRIIGSSAAGETLIWQVHLTPPCAIVVGNESTGLSEDLRRQCDSIIRIPMYGKAHSLNVTVAAGILLYEATRGPKATHRLSN